MTDWPTSVVRSGLDFGFQIVSPGTETAIRFGVQADGRAVRFLFGVSWIAGPGSLYSLLSLILPRCQLSMTPDGQC